MDQAIIERLKKLTSAHLSDACLRIGIEVRCAPAELQAIDKSMKCVGRVRPARHVGAIDPFLIAMERADPGDVLVVDDGGNKDWAAVGDLIAHETQDAGMSGIIIWGLNRDTDEQLEIGLPIFSLGQSPTGPLRVDILAPDCNEWARVGNWIVTEKDFVVADFDGVIFLPEDRLEELVEAAEGVLAKEDEQRADMARGISIREQIHFADFVERRKENPKLTLREFLVTEVELPDSSEFVLRKEK